MNTLLDVVVCVCVCVCVNSLKHMKKTLFVHVSAHEFTMMCGVYQNLLQIEIWQDVVQKWPLRAMRGVLGKVIGQRASN